MNKRNKKPPKLAQLILEFLCNQEVLGDFEEAYKEIFQKDGGYKAGYYYWLQIFVSMPTFLSRLIRKGSAMFKNYFKMTSRSIMKHKLYSGINIFGLSVGIALCFLLVNFVRNETTYDSFHEDIDNIHRVTFTLGGRAGYATPAPLGPRIKEVIPDVKYAVRFMQGGAFVAHNEKKFSESVMYADTDFLNMFSFPLVAGTKENWLNERKSTVISEKIANKYFGDDEAVGKSLDFYLNNQPHTFTVAAVMDKIPENSSLLFDILIPFEYLSYSFRPGFLTDWSGFDPNTFISLRGDAAVSAVVSKFDSIIENDLGSSKALTPGQLKVFKIVLQPYKEYHLGSIRGGNGLAQRFDPQNILILSGLALLILLIACFNFMNLSFGRMSSRIKEIGVRKVLGAQRKQLIRQFLFEAVFLSFIAMIGAVVLQSQFKPIFADFVGKSLATAFSFDLYSFAVLIVVPLAVGLFTGMYPAYVISRFKPGDTLDNRLKKGGKNLFMRGLVVSQFALSVFLIAVTVFMTRQMDFIKNMDIGFDHDHVLSINTGSSSVRQTGNIRNAFKDKLSGETNIVSISGVQSAFARGGGSSTDVRHEGKQIVVSYFITDEDLLQTLDIKLLEGRNFSGEFASDPRKSILVNENFVRTFGLKNPLNSIFPDLKSSRIPRDPEIIGIFKDFNFESLRTEVSPLVISMNPSIGTRYILVKIKPQDVSETLALLERTWNEIVPDRPFNFRFMDEDLNSQYRSEQKWASIIAYSSLAAIVIACLGLFALVDITVMKRKKEIGIRKVLGASSSRLLSLISKEFLILVAIANIISWPAAYYVINKWIQSFSYRIELDLLTFFLTGAAALIIAFATVSYQSMKTALSNPVDSLRYE